MYCGRKEKAGDRPVKHLLEADSIINLDSTGFPDAIGI
jgi:hypothetical protein